MPVRQTKAAAERSNAYDLPLYIDDKIVVMHDAVTAGATRVSITASSDLQLRYSYCYVMGVTFSFLFSFYGAIDFLLFNKTHWAAIISPIIVSLLCYFAANDLDLVCIRDSGEVVTLLRGVRRAYGKRIIEMISKARQEDLSATG